MRKLLVKVKKLLFFEKADFSESITRCQLAWYDWHDIISYFIPYFSSAISALFPFLSVASHPFLIRKICHSYSLLAVLLRLLKINLSPSGRPGAELKLKQRVYNIYCMLISFVPKLYAYLCREKHAIPIEAFTEKNETARKDYFQNTGKLIKIPGNCSPSFMQLF